jgi:hypothetical protein
MTNWIIGHCFYKVMKMSLLFLIWVTLLPVTGAKCNAQSPGDTLYVWASQGLLLRKDPSFKSDIVTKLSYGTKVVVEEITRSNAGFEIVKSQQINNTLTPPIILKGRFVKVTAGGKVGFLSDGFLSSLPPIDSNEQLKNYFYRVFGGGEILKEIKHENSGYTFLMCSFSKGVFLQEEQGRENSWDCFYLIPNITVQEAYLLINRLTSFEANFIRELEAGVEAHEYCPITFDDNAVVLQISLFDTTEIRMRNNFVTITRSGGN